MQRGMLLLEMWLLVEYSSNQDLTVTLLSAADFSWPALQYPGPSAWPRAWHRELLPGAAMNSLWVMPSICSLSRTSLSQRLMPEAWVLSWVQGTPSPLLQSWGATGLHMQLSKSWLPAQECGYQLGPGLIKQMKCCLAFQKECLSTSRTVLAAFMQNLLFVLQKMGGFSWV